MQLQISQNELKKTENAFYEFLLQILTLRPAISNQIFYKKFLISQFNTFAIGEGYPLISLQCESPLCYFYIKIQITSDFQHDFFKLINRQIQQFPCKNCSKYINKNSIIYDTALEGLIQYKIPNNQLRWTKIAQITKSHQILVQKISVFNEAFNNERLKIISSIKQKYQAQDNFQLKSLKVDSFELINSIHSNIMNYSQFTGKMKPTNHMIPESTRAQPILAICIARKEELWLHLFKQFNHSPTITKIGLEFHDKPAPIIAEYYDYTNHIFYLLTSEGNLYKCDLRYMYNFGNGKYLLQKWCSLQNFPSQLQNNSNKIVIRSDDLYFFVGKRQERYIQLFKAKIPSEASNNYIKLKQILNNQIYYRQGYSVSFIHKNLLLHSQCIIIFGGAIQNISNFSPFQIIELCQPQNYMKMKLFIEQKDFSLVQCIICPVISIFMEYLVIVGGYDQNKQMENASVLMISLKSPEKIVKKDYASPRKCRLQHAFFSYTSFIGINYTIIVFGNSFNNTQAIRINRSNKYQRPIIDFITFN